MSSKVSSWYGYGCNSFRLPRPQSRHKYKQTPICNWANNDELNSIQTTSRKHFFFKSILTVQNNSFTYLPKNTPITNHWFWYQWNKHTQISLKLWYDIIYFHKKIWSYLWFDFIYAKYKRRYFVVFVIDAPKISWKEGRRHLILVIDDYEFHRYGPNRRRIVFYECRHRKSLGWASIELRRYIQICLTL